jgi:2-enoate reductase
MGMVKLFERARIGNLRLKNRLIMSPMGTASDIDGGYSAQSKDYYVERAKGGFGLIMLACAVATDKYETRPNNMLNDFHQVGRLTSLVEQCHHYGAKVGIQLSPGVGRMGFSDPHNPPYAPSPIPSCWFPDLLCKPYSVEQIHDMIKKVGYSAKLAKTAGVDAIGFQGYGGYLIDQFMTSLWNTRRDEYGGSLENRMRFPLELIAEVRQICGADFPLIFKFTASHEVEGGRTIEEGIAIAKILEKAGVSALHVDKGCHEAYFHQISTVYTEDANKVPLAARIKQEVGIPVFCDGKLGDPVLAATALDRGDIDFVAMAKQTLAEPHWANKVKNGELAHLRPCMYCNECHFGMHEGKLLNCAVNPQCGYEKDYPIIKSENPKRVLIVGGGPGGMQCAITATQRGHIVELWEARSRLGGTLAAAAAPSFKTDVRRYLNYLILHVYESGAAIRLGKEATPDAIRTFHADELVLATGASPVVPPVNGVGRAKRAYDVLLGAPMGDRIAVIGGGLVGCETALMLAMQGKTVSLVEMMGKLLPRDAINVNNEQALFKMIRKWCPDVRLNTRLLCVEEGSVTLEFDGKMEKIFCDDVVLAVGYRPLATLEEALSNEIENLHTIGDCVRPRKVYAAVHEGFHVARLI